MKKQIQLDDISTDLLKLAYTLEAKKPGSISECWIGEPTISTIQNCPVKDPEIQTFIESYKNKLAKIEDHHRKTYIIELVKSIEYQLFEEFKTLTDISQTCFGHKITPISDEELIEIEDKISKLEKKINKSRFEVFKTDTVSNPKIITEYKQKLDQVKSQVPFEISNIPTSQFTVNLVKGQPWNAFNSHITPYQSQLEINADMKFTHFDLFKLAQHEGWGGHHAELSLKDNLLVNQGRGEHGIILIYSPQSFISEAIAEGMFEILGFKDQLEPKDLLQWYYTRLKFGLQSRAADLFINHKKNKSVISRHLKKYNISQNTLDEILSFSTDKQYAAYSAVYFSAYNFLTSVFEKTKDKNTIIQRLFNEPITANMLIELKIT